ncbi:MAG: zinc ABC transporter substrate-binding protein [Anaerolineaceae bacterium]|nr:zinc ABC transporter substrate-binding protein [Anaerolineaceae bacterium]
MHKHQKSIKPFVLFILLALVIVPVLSACQSTAAPAAQDTDQVNVTVSIVPLAYFAERIGGDWVNINIMVGPGEEPHSYEPTPEQMVAISESPVFFSIGVEYEDVWLPKFVDNNPDMLVVDTSAGIERIPVATSVTEVGEQPEAEDDRHDEEGGLDPHVWLSPENGKIIAENMLNGLIEIAPQHEADFQNNFAALIAEIDALDAQIQETLAGDQNQSFIVFHPAWGYFAKQYGLEQIAVQVGGQDPSASELADLVDIARARGITVIFVQPTFNSASAEALAQEIGGTVAVANPLAEDWLGNLGTIASALAESFGEQ